jgi:ATP-dependent phosphoenolpyruvate carboxykinase
MTTMTLSSRLNFGNARIHRNAAPAQLIEEAIKRGEGVLAANGALRVDTTHLSFDEQVEMIVAYARRAAEPDPDA